MNHDELPSPDDFVLFPTGSLGGQTGVSRVQGKHLGTYATTEEALEAVRRIMEAEQYWPNIWYESDHGNAWLIDLEGREVVQ